jgi:hypothetical protein
MASLPGLVARAGYGYAVQGRPLLSMMCSW